MKKLVIGTFLLTLFVASGTAFEYDYNPSTFLSNDSQAEISFTGLSPSTEYTLSYVKSSSGDFVQVDSFQSSATGTYTSVFTHAPFENDIDNVGLGYQYVLEYGNGTTAGNVYLSHGNYLNKIDSFFDEKLNSYWTSLGASPIESGGVLTGSDITTDFLISDRTSAIFQGTGTFRFNQSTTSVNIPSYSNIEMKYNKSVSEYQIWSNDSLQYSAFDSEGGLWKPVFSSGGTTIGFEESTNFQDYDFSGDTGLFEITSNPSIGNIKYGSQTGQFDDNSERGKINHPYDPSVGESVEMSVYFKTSNIYGKGLKLETSDGTTLAVIQYDSGDIYKRGVAEDGRIDIGNAVYNEWVTWKLKIEEDQLIRLIAEVESSGEIIANSTTDFSSTTYDISQINKYIIAGRENNPMLFDNIRTGTGSGAGIESFTSVPSNSAEYWKGNTFNPGETFQLGEITTSFSGDPGLEFDTGSGYSSSIPTDEITDSISYRNTANGTVNYLDFQTVEPNIPEISLFNTDDIVVAPRMDVQKIWEINGGSTGAATRDFIRPAGGNWSQAGNSEITQANESEELSDIYLNIGNGIGINQVGNYEYGIAANSGTSSTDLPEQYDQASFYSDSQLWDVDTPQVQIRRPGGGTVYGTSDITFEFVHERAEFNRIEYNLRIYNQSSGELVKTVQGSRGTNSEPYSPVLFDSIEDTTTVEENLEVSIEEPGTYEYNITVESGGIQSSSSTQEFAYSQEENIDFNLDNPRDGAVLNYTDTSVEFNFSVQAENSGDVFLRVEDPEDSSTVYDSQIATHPGNDTVQYSETLNLDSARSYEWYPIYNSDFSGQNYYPGSTNVFEIEAEPFEGTIDISSPAQSETFTILDQDSVSVPIEYTVESNKQAVVKENITRSGTSVSEFETGVGADESYSANSELNVSKTGDYTLTIEIEDQQTGEVITETRQFDVQELSLGTAGTISEFYHALMVQALGISVSVANIFAAFLITIAIAGITGYVAGATVGAVSIPASLLFTGMMGLLPVWTLPIFLVLTGFAVFYIINSSG